MHVNDIVKGQSFKLKEVKEHIKRELALEQLPQSVVRKCFGKNLMRSGFTEI